MSYAPSAKSASGRIQHEEEQRNAVSLRRVQEQQEREADKARDDGHCSPAGSDPLGEASGVPTISPELLSRMRKDVDNVVEPGENPTAVAEPLRSALKKRDTLEEGQTTQQHGVSFEPSPQRSNMHATLHPN